MLCAFYNGRDSRCASCAAKMAAFPVRPPVTARMAAFPVRPPVAARMAAFPVNAAFQTE